MICESLGAGKSAGNPWDSTAIVIGVMFTNLAIERGPTNCGNYWDFMGNPFSLAQFWGGVESPTFFYR